MGFLRHYWFDLIITALAFAYVGIFISPLMLFPLFVLLILEVSFSFDNAVVNAKVLERMSPLWQKLFLTVGLLIAVGGMRFVFPIAIVAVTAGLSFGGVLDLALTDASGYAEKLDVAHPLIAMFGGVYLLLIFLDFVFEERDIKWLRFLEVPLAKVGRLDSLSFIITGVFVLVAAATFGNAHQTEILIAGFSSLVLYMVVKAISSIFDNEDDENANKGVRHGWAAFSLFLYLEVQDSAFSFDGVAAAFAITNVLPIIVLGLGLGALYVRSMTVHLVRTKQLAQFRYLEHGAHWAIGVLAVCMLIGVSDFVIPDYIVGFVGVIFITAAVLHSRRDNKKDAAAALLAPSDTSSEESAKEKISA